MAGAVLIWAALAVVPLVSLASGWAVVSGALMLAATRWLSNPHRRCWLLAFAGAVSVGRGALAGAAGPLSADDPRTAAPWLLADVLVFGATLLVVTFRRKRRQREAAAMSLRSPR